MNSSDIARVRELATSFRPAIVRARERMPVSLQFTPVVHPNRIANFVQSAGNTLAYNRVIGTVGAHELVHRITGIGDLPYDRSSPTDLMSVDDPNNTQAGRLMIDNGLSLTSNEGLALQAKCLEKHPE